MNNIDNKPLVAIHCLVYNHEPYLRDCFEGFVMQQTNFPFVAIVHDDASTDASAAIIREYEEKYPDIIKPIYEAENLYQKGGFTAINEVMNTAIDASGAKYVAMCEGDDYWTDPLKLQKQVDFMEANPEYSLCFHPVMVLNQGTGEMLPDTLRQVPDTTTIEDLALYSNYIHTPSVMYRYNREVPLVMSQMGRIAVGDYLQHMLYAQYGAIYKLPEYMAVYRSGVGVWTGPKSDSRRNGLTWIVAISKLSSILYHKEGKAALDEQIYEHVDDLVTLIHKLEKDAQSVRSTYAYRLGKFILAPFKKIKQLFKL